MTPQGAIQRRWTSTQPHRLRLRGGRGPLAGRAPPLHRPRPLDLGAGGVFAGVAPRRQQPARLDPLAELARSLLPAAAAAPRPVRRAERQRPDGAAALAFGG